eukprot:1187248-Prorocentrum_minimum.AAC.3
MVSVIPRFAQRAELVRTQDDEGLCSESFRGEIFKGNKLDLQDRVFDMRSARTCGLFAVRTSGAGWVVSSGDASTPHSPTWQHPTSLEVRPPSLPATCYPGTTGGNPSVVWGAHQPKVSGREGIHHETVQVATNALVVASRGII